MSNIHDLTPLVVGGRRVRFHKGVVAPDLGARTVLTQEPWTYVSLWLKRKKKTTALAYWDQAQDFQKASEYVSINSRPLILYYSFMNASKALLTAKSLSFSPYHGVTSDSKAPRKKVVLANDIIKIMSDGVLPGLSTYYSEQELAKKHSFKEILYNIPFIHRTFCLTYTSVKSMFLPLKNAGYYLDASSGKVFIAADVSGDYTKRDYSKRMPASFEVIGDRKDAYIKSIDSVSVKNSKKLTNLEIKQVVSLHNKIRRDLFYINGAETLWYLKTSRSQPSRIERQTPTLTLAAMHRLSEVCRYRALEWSALLAGQENWLISEFVAASSRQFVDEIATEITGFQFLQPNVRPAN